MADVGFGAGPVAGRAAPAGSRSATDASSRRVLRACSCTRSASISSRAPVSPVPMAFMVVVLGFFLNSRRLATSSSLNWRAVAGRDAGFFESTRMMKRSSCTGISMFVPGTTSDLGCSFRWLSSSFMGVSAWKGGTPDSISYRMMPRL